MRKLLLASLVGCIATESAQAAIIYTDRATFNAAGAGTSTYLDLESGYTSGSSGPFTFSNVTITGTGQTAAVYFNSTSGLAAPDNSNYIRYALGNPISSPTSVQVSSTLAFTLIGFDTRAFNNNNNNDSSGFTVNFTTNLGDSGSFTLGSSTTTAFDGLQFSNPVSSVTFSSTGTNIGTSSIFGTDDYQLYSAAFVTPPAPTGVPEPTSMSLLAVGAAGLGLIRRRRARSPDGRAG